MLLLLMLGMVIYAQQAYSAQVVLTWGKLSDPVTGYKIYYGPASGNYTQIIDVGNVTTYTIGNLTSGAYYIAATDHDALGNESGFSNEIIAVIPSVHPVSAVDVTAAPASPRASGTNITFNATATGGSGPYQYEFWLRSTIGTWSLVRAYGASSWQWNTAGSIAGSYSVQAWGRNTGSTASYEAYRQVNYTLVAPVLPVTSVNFTSIVPPSPQNARNPVTFTVTAVGTSGNYEYAFYLRNPGSSVWNIVRPYGSSSFVWTTTVLPAGIYSFQVWARNTGSAASYEAYKSLSYTLR
jgi:hypothetical protein